MSSNFGWTDDQHQAPVSGDVAGRHRLCLALGPDRRRGSDVETGPREQPGLLLHYGRGAEATVYGVLTDRPAVTPTGHPGWSRWVQLHAASGRSLAQFVDYPDGFGGRGRHTGRQAGGDGRLASTAERSKR